MNPFDHEEAYRSLFFGTKRSPGSVTLSGHDRNRQWDVKSASGQDGASSTLNSTPIGEFEATFYLVRDYLNDVDEFEEWSVFQRELDASTSGPTPKAFPIYHPDLAQQNFTECSVSSVGGLIHDGKGGAIVKVKFIEYKPAKIKPPNKAKSKPGSGKGAGAGGSGVQFGPPAPDPNQAAKDELDGLLDEAKQP